MAKKSDHLDVRGRGLTKTYSYRRRVPTDLWPLLGKYIYGKICRGGDPALAEIEALRRDTIYESIFARARAGEVIDLKRAELEAQISPELHKALRLVRLAGPVQLPQQAIVDTFDLFGTTAPAPTPAMRTVPALATGDGITVSQAFEAMVAQMKREKARQGTIDGHKRFVGQFIEDMGDMPLVAISKAIVSDWRDKLASKEGRSNKTVNTYITSMLCVVKSAASRGRFEGANVFEKMGLKKDGKSYVPFEDAEVKAFFDATPVEVKPAQHSPQTALPWIVRIAAYTGARLEEITQLKKTDISMEGLNGGSKLCFHMHEEDENNHLKNSASTRIVPVHSRLCEMGFEKYFKGLPAGSMLFPGLTRRESRDNKIGGRSGELFRKLGIKLGITKKGKCFHSWRHSAIGAMRRADISLDDREAVCGHTSGRVNNDVYTTGPGLVKLTAAVEAINYAQV
jgi:integrase